MEGWSLLLDPIHVLPTHFLGTSIASMPVQSSSSSSVPCKPSSLHPSFFIRTHLLVLGQLRSNMSEDMLGTYHVFVVGEVVLVHDRCDGQAMLMAALPSLVNTMYGRLLNPASIRAVRRSESVIHSGFLTTEVTGDGLDVMIGIHEHGRQQLAVVTTERCINVDHRRWVVQEAVHQGLDLITHVMAVMCLNIFVLSLSLSFSCPASLLADS